MNSSNKSSRHLPDAFWHNWTARHLPSAQRFFITDIDMIIRTMDNKIMIVEKKCRNSEPSKCQSVTYQMLHGFIMNSDKRGPLQVATLGNSMQSWTYYGYHLIQFENTNFEDGKVYFDRQEVTEQELANILAFNSDRVKILASSE